MQLELRRITLFTPNMAGWQDFRAGVFHVALHEGQSQPGRHMCAARTLMPTPSSASRK